MVIARVVDSSYRGLVTHLANANIIGSDAETCLRTLYTLVPTYSGVELLRAVHGITAAAAFDRFGADAGRAAYALGRLEIV